MTTETNPKLIHPSELRWFEENRQPTRNEILFLEGKLGLAEHPAELEQIGYILVDLALRLVEGR